MSNHILFVGDGADKTLANTCHFLSPVMGDFTLCGVTLDGDPDTAGGFGYTPQKVNCKHCISIVDYGKSVSKKEYLTNQ